MQRKIISLLVVCFLFVLTSISTQAIELRGYPSDPIFHTATTPKLYGGAAANDDITIEGTSHATKTTSYVILQPTGGSVGVGTATPVSATEVSAALGTTLTSLTLTNTTTGAVGNVVPLDFRLSNSFDGAPVTTAQINAVSNNGGARDTLLKFYTRSGSGALTEYLAIGDTGLLTFQGQTAASPGLKRVAAGLETWLGDGSAQTRFGASVLYGNGMELPHVIKKAASANIRNSHDAEATSQSVTYVKVKTLTITNGLVGAQRFLFDIKTSNVLNTASASLFYNGTTCDGTLLGAEQTDVTGVYATKSQDITQTFNPGDTIRVCIKIDDVAETASIKNVRLAYDDSATVTVAASTSTP